MKIFMLSLMALLIVPLSSCSTDNKEKGMSHMTFADDLFYFNSVVEYRIKDGIKISSILRIESGSIRIYGNVIVTRRTTGPVNYFIESRHYDEEEEIYYYYTAEGVEIEFDICSKKMKIEDGENGIEFYINSDITSDW